MSAILPYFSIVIAFVLAFAFAYFLRKPIRVCSWLFYLIALAIDVVLLTGVVATVLPSANRIMFVYIQRSLFAFGLLSIVMFIGVLPDENSIKKKLRPIRGELSIIASILVAGHVIQYFEPMILRMFNSNVYMTTGTFIGTCISIILVILLVVLGVTSFKFVRNAMKPTTWKRIQVWAYPFYILCFAHLAAMLLPSAVSGGSKAIVSAILYTVLMVLYIVARLVRAKLDKQHEASKPAEENKPAEESTATEE